MAEFSNWEKDLKKENHVLPVRQSKLAKNTPGEAEPC